jgi:hypothetical protein
VSAGQGAGQMGSYGGQHAPVLAPNQRQVTSLLYTYSWTLLEEKFRGFPPNPDFMNSLNPVYLLIVNFVDILRQLTTRYTITFNIFIELKCYLSLIFGSLDIFLVC